MDITVHERAIDRYTLCLLDLLFPVTCICQCHLISDWMPNHVHQVGQLPCRLTSPPRALSYERLPRFGRTCARSRLILPLLCQQEANKVPQNITRRQVIAVPGDLLIATGAISSAGRETSLGYSFSPCWNQPNILSSPVRSIPLQNMHECC